jgi:hypothetical protein
MITIAAIAITTVLTKITIPLTLHPSCNPR